MSELDSFIANLPDKSPENTGDDDLSFLPDTNGSLLRNQYRNTQPNSAEIVNLQKRTGLPETVISRNKPEVEKRANEPDWTALESSSPKTASLFAQDQELFKLANDDILNMGAFEGAWHDIKTGWRRGEIIDELGLLGHRFRDGVPTAEQAKRAGSLQKELQTLKGSEGFLEAGSELIGQMAQIFPQALTTGLGTGMAASAPVFIAGQAGPQVASPFEEIGGAAIFQAGLTAGMLGEFAEHSYKVEGGHAYLDMIEAGVDVDTAKYASMGVGLINSSLEVIGVSAVAAPFKKLLNKALTKQATKTLTKATYSQAARNAAKAYGAAWATETGTEVTQEIVTIIGEEIAKTYSLEEYESLISTEAGRDQIASRLWEVFEKVGKGMALLAAPGAVVTYASDSMKARKANETVRVLQAISDTTGEHVLRGRDGDKYQNYVENVTADGPITKAYLSPTTFVQLFQEAGLNPEEVAKEIPSVASQLEVAMETGQKIEIPIAEWINKVAGTQYHEALVNHVAFAPDDMTAAEAQQFRNQEAEQFREEADSILQDYDNAVEYTESIERVENFIKEQVQAAGVTDKRTADTYSRLHGAFASTIADATGVKPHEVYDTYGLNVSRETPQRPGQQAAPEAELDPAKVAEYEQAQNDSNLFEIAEYC